MKDIDFLPEWYKEGKRRRLHMRRQYAVLTVVFLTMMTYNLTAEHRIARASAQMARLEDQRVEAEEVLREFNRISRVLGAHKAKAEAIRRIDSRIDLAAVLAEISHIVEERVILSRVEFIAEPVARTDTKKTGGSGSAVRAASKTTDASKTVPWGDARFRIVLAGAAVESGDVTTLVCKLDESAYFKKVNLSWSRPGRISISPAAGKPMPNATNRTAAREMLQVSDFEITCYLANYEEIGN